MDRVFFCNSGVEAVEAAIKLARKYAASKDRQGNMVAMERCFHGRTLATIAMGSEKYRKGFEPMPSGFETIPMNDLEALIKTTADNPIAIILEVIQGEGGIHPVDHEYLVKLRDICTDKDILLILDEIQCGMGRTGEMFAYQHHGIKPDIMTTAKALGNGFPIGAMLATQKAAEAFQSGNHGTTFGGNPLACAAAGAVLETMSEENIPQKAAEKGEYLRDRLQRGAEGCSAIKDIRGRGLMIGVELAFKGADVVVRMMDRGILANCTADTVIRLTPPLIIDNDEIDRIVDILVESIKEVESNLND
jgi:acetylornithine/N-succinyldiaminopimelate aminotransferase